MKGIAGLLGIVGAILFLVYSIMAFGGPDNLDDAKVMGGLNGLGYTMLTAAIGLYFLDNGMSQT